RATGTDLRPVPSVELGQAEVPRDHHALHLVRSLADLEDLLVAVEARDRRFLHEAVAAVDLERGVDDAMRELAGVELRHRRLEAELALLVLQPGRLVDERSAGLDLDRHVRQLELDRLERRDRLPELLPLQGVRVREVVGALREADAHRSDRDPPAVEDLQELAEALAALAEQVPLRNRAALEGELAGVGRAPAELLHRGRDLVAGGAV